GNNVSILNILAELAVLIHYLAVNREAVLVFLNPKPYKLIACCFEFRCNNVSNLRNVHSKGNQCRRYIDILEGSGHTVLSSYGWKSVSDLCAGCTKECRNRLTPAFRIFCHSASILLGCYGDFAAVSPGSYFLCFGL